MPFIGNTPDVNFTSFAKQDLTGVTGSPAKRGFTLSHAVANANEIEVFVNNVRQEPTESYTVNGTGLTMTGDVETSDDFYIIYLGKAIQTTVPPDGSVSTAKIADDAVNLTSKVTGVLPFANGGLSRVSYVWVYPQGTAGYQTVAPSATLPLNTIWKSSGTGTNDFNTSTYVYTAPCDGLYYISFKTISSSASDNKFFVVDINGTPTMNTHFGKDSRQVDASQMYLLSSGDAVSIEAIGNTSSYYRHTATMPSADIYTYGIFCLMREL